MTEYNDERYLELRKQLADVVLELLEIEDFTKELLLTTVDEIIFKNE